VIGLSPGEHSELRRLVGRLAAGPTHPAPRATADDGEARRVVELLGRSRRHERAHASGRGARGRGKPRRLNLLLINRNDRRVVGLRVRWRPAAAAILGAVVLTVMIGTVSRDYARLRHQRSVFAALQGQVASNEALLDDFGARVREIRDEVESWRLARIFEPLRPDSAPSRPEDDVAEIESRSPFGAERADAVDEETARLLTVVEQAGDRLRSLEHFVGENGSRLASLPSSWPVRGPLTSDFGPRRSPFTLSSPVSPARRVATRPTSLSPPGTDPLPAH
jgi:hypothetical protein